MSEQEAQLTLKDRLNFPYLLANQILTFQKAILALEYSAEEIRETIEGFVHMIPDDMKDDEFLKDLEEAQKTEKVDVRPIIASRIRMSEETCEQLGIPAFEEKTVFDYYAMFQACMNLLSRRGMLTKIARVEILEGIDLTNVTEDEVQRSDIFSK